VVTLSEQTGTVSFAKDGYSIARFHRAPRNVQFGAGVLLHTTECPNPGLPFLLQKGEWQKRTEPFFITLTATEQTREERAETFRKIKDLLAIALPSFAAPVALAIDLTPFLDETEQPAFKEEVLGVLAMLVPLSVPLVPVVSISLAPDVATDIMSDSNCDGLWLSGDIPWSAFPERARKVFFRTERSPLEKYGGGAVSGKYSMPLVLEWLHQRQRQIGGVKPVIADGGMLRPKDGEELLAAGAAAVVFGPVFVLRPWNVRRMLRRMRTFLKQ
jgi:dihydroorotate dehydrogenase